MFRQLSGRGVEPRQDPSVQSPEETGSNESVVISNEEKLMIGKYLDALIDAFVYIQFIVKNINTDDKITYTEGISQNIYDSIDTVAKRLEAQTEITLYDDIMKCSIILSMEMWRREQIRLVPQVLNSRVAQIINPVIDVQMIGELEERLINFIVESKLRNRKHNKNILKSMLKNNIDALLKGVLELLRNIVEERILKLQNVTNNELLNAMKVINNNLVEMAESLISKADQGDIENIDTGVEFSIQNISPLTPMLFARPTRTNRNLLF